LKNIDWKWRERVGGRKEKQTKKKKTEKTGLNVQERKRHNDECS